MSDLKVALFKPFEKFEETAGECFELLTREREARVRAETANRKKDEFLMIVAHELRNSMNSIVGWLELLRHEELSGPIARKAIESIDRGVKRQVKLIEDLLDLSQISNGKLRLDLREVEMLPVLEEALNEFKVLAEARQIELEADFGRNLGRLMADSHRLEQVLSNLLANAVKYTEAGGKVCVMAAQEELYLEITVSDTGQGIDSEFLPFVFEPFRQVAHKANGKREGLGLGLSIVRHLIDLHGGTIKADSAGCGKGSMFTIRLPKKPPTAFESNPSPPTKALPLPTPLAF
jgi:signal transduction histidine kinase